MAGSPYPITCDLTGVSAANYSFTSVAGALTVTPATLTVTAENKSKVYGSANPPLTYVISGFQNGETDAVVTGTAVCSTTATELSTAAGNPYPITCDVTGLSAANYSFTAVAGALTVTSAGLTVTADNQTRAYGAANPALTFVITGFQNGDDAGDLTTQPTCSTTGGRVQLGGRFAVCDHVLGRRRRHLLLHLRARSTHGDTGELDRDRGEQESGVRRGEPGVDVCDHRVPER